MSNQLPTPGVLADQRAEGTWPTGQTNVTPSPIRVGFVLHMMAVAGAEMLVADIVKQLKGRIEPVVFCLDGIGALGEQLRAEGVEVLALGRRPGRDHRLAWRLGRAARAFRIEVLHAHQYTPFYYAALARIISADTFRLVLTEHGRAYPDIVSTARRWGNRLVLARLADEVNAVCNSSRWALAHNDGFPARRTSVIKNGVHIERYGPPGSRDGWKRHLGLDPSRRLVTCIARLHPVKDHTTLVRAFARVAPLWSDVDLLIVGNGECRNQLVALVDMLGLATRVRFAGIRSDVPDLLRASDIFALTSLSEAASLTLLEAMATGLPVVVTDVGGNPEIVRSGTDGLIVTQGDEVATAEALGTLLGNPARAESMGAAARTRAQGCYDIERTIAAYHVLYRRLAGRETLA